MRIFSWLVGLTVVLFACWSLRAWGDDFVRVPDHLTLEGGTRYQIYDFDGAYHARRVQVALASGEVPAYDTYINAPLGSPVPWPTFFDGLLTAVVELAVDPVRDGPPELGGYLERDVEAVLVRVPPWIGVVAALGCVLAVLAAVRREGPTDGSGPAAPTRYGPWFALAAGLVYATQPTAVMYGGFGRLDHHVATAAFLALQLAFCVRALCAREPIEATLMAAGVGLAGACGVLTWLAHGVVLGVCGIGFALRALSSDAVESRRGWQGGATCFAVATLVTLVPAWGSPWNETQPGSLINLSLGVPRALGAAAVPFLVYGLSGRRLRGRPARAALGTLALVAVVALLPGFVPQVLEGVRWADRTNQFMAVIDESQPMWTKQVFGVGGFLGHLGHTWYALPVAALLLLARPRPERVVLFLAVALFVAFAWKQRRFANSLAVPMSIALGVGAFELVRLGASVLPRALGARAAHVLAFVLLGALVLGSAMAGRIPLRPRPVEMAAVAERWNHLLSGLRWMRSNTPSPGPWNEPGIEPTYTVLSSWSFGHLIEYHARRPTIATNFGSFVGLENFQAAPRALLADDPEEFYAQVDRLGVRYVVTSPQVLQWFMDEARVAGWSEEERRTLVEEVPTPDGRRVFSYTARALRSPYFQLTLHDQRPGERSRRFPRLALVWRSPIRTEVSGKLAAPDVVLAGPSLSVWRVDP